MRNDNLHVTFKPDWTKIVACLAMLGVAIVAQSMGLPVSFTLGASEETNTPHIKATKAKKAISSIMESVSDSKYGCELVDAANDIYEIVNDEEADDDVLTEAIAALGELASRARYSCDRESITDLIKMVALM